MYRIVLCDDESNTLSLLKEYLSLLSQSRGWEFEIRMYSSAEALLESALDETDLLVLDIGMDGLSGMEAARIIRQRGHTFYILFLTSMVEYALEGYDVRAFAFIKKPISYERFAEKISEAIEEITRRQGVVLCLKSGMAADYISSKDILYIDVRDHNIRIVLPDSDKTYYEKLQTVEKLLSGQGFYRCHKSFLVNFRHIRSIRQDAVIMQNGEQLPISRHRRREFLSEFAKYVGRGL